jgi:hypothetical protein
MLLLSDNFRNICKKATLYLDTNVVIYAHEQVELVDLIGDLTNNGTAFTTVSAVEYEFTRGAQSLQEVKDRKAFVRGLVHRVIPVGQLLDSDRNNAFSVAMSLNVGRKDSHFTDYILATALHNFGGGAEKQYVLSADIPAFPLSLFTISGVISLGLNNGRVVHVNLIELDKDKYRSVAQAIAKK